MTATESDDRRGRRSVLRRLTFWLLVAAAGVAMLVALVTLLMLSGWRRDPVTELPICSSFITHTMTGDLASDLVGAWNGTTGEGGWHHPIAYMAGQGERTDPQQSKWTGGRIWMFRPDGTGHVWWVYNQVGSGSYENDEEFVWDVVEEKLVVNDPSPGRTPAPRRRNVQTHSD